MTRKLLLDRHLVTNLALHLLLLLLPPLAFKRERTRLLHLPAPLLLLLLSLPSTLFLSTLCLETTALRLLPLPPELLLATAYRPLPSLP